MFNLFSKEQSRYCPGGVCEIQRKDPVQTFTTAQKIILSLTIFAVFYGTYAYFTKLPDRTFLVKKVKDMMLSDEERERIEATRDIGIFKNTQTKIGKRWCRIFGAIWFIRS